MMAGKRTIRTAFVIALGGMCVGAGGLSAQAFKAGDIFLELGVGAGRPEGKAVNSLRNSTLYQVEAAVNITSSNSERMALGLAQLSALESSRASSISGRLGFEYALEDWFGFGVALNSLKAKVDPVYFATADSPTLLFLQSTGTYCTPFVCSNSAPTANEYATLQAESVESEPFNTLDFDFNFHVFTRERLDPYIRLTIGLGKIRDRNLAKLGLALGARYMLTGNIYVQGDLTASSYSVVVDPERLRSVRRSVESQRNGGIRLGAGYKF